jgi:hypothetical protein
MTGGRAQADPPKLIAGLVNLSLDVITKQWTFDVSRDLVVSKLRAGEQPPPPPLRGPGSAPSAAPILQLLRPNSANGLQRPTQQQDVLRRVTAFLQFLARDRVSAPRHRCADLWGATRRRRTDSHTPGLIRLHCRALDAGVAAARLHRELVRGTGRGYAGGPHPRSLRVHRTSPEQAHRRLPAGGCTGLRPAGCAGYTDPAVQVLQGVSLEDQPLRKPMELLLGVLRAAPQALWPDMIDVLTSNKSHLQMAARGLLTLLVESSGNAALRAPLLDVRARCQQQQVTVDYQNHLASIEVELKKESTDSARTVFLLWLQLGLVSAGLVHAPPFAQVLPAVLTIWADELRTKQSHEEYFVGAARYSLPDILRAWTEHFAASADRSWLLWVLQTVNSGALALPDAFLEWAAPDVARKRWASAACAAELAPVCSLVLSSVPHGRGLALDLLERLARSDRRVELCQQVQLAELLAALLSSGDASMRPAVICISVALLQVLAARDVKIKLGQALQARFADIITQPLQLSLSFGELVTALHDLGEPDGPRQACELVEVLLKAADDAAGMLAVGFSDRVADQLRDLCASLAKLPAVQAVVTGHTAMLLGTVGTRHQRLRGAVLQVTCSIVFWRRADPDR